MKNFLYLFALLLCVGFVSCENEYDADTAESNYEAAPGKRVASVKTVFFENSHKSNRL